MAPFGHAELDHECPLLREERTYLERAPQGPLTILLGITSYLGV